jgi:probable F420-dependent oxidoreductase
MRVGVVLPNTHPTLADADLVVAAARAAEAAGLDSVWLNDHVVMPKAAAEGNAVQQQYARSVVLDPLGLLCALAVATERVELGVSVLVLPYRHPLLVAKLVATADRLSNGRVILGVGSGWMETQFTALGVPFRRRGRITDEYIEALQAALSSEEPSYEGTFVSFDGIRIAPSPSRPVPLWVGGRSENGARRAARHGLPWHPSHWSFDELEQNTAWLREAAAAAGREPPPLTFRVKWDADGGDHGLDDVPAGLARLAELGVEHVVVEVPAGDGDELLARVAEFGELVSGARAAAA